MNPLRLLAITALFAWFIFPSQSLSQCDGAIELTVTLTTDDWPGETTWSLVDETGNVLLEGGPYLQDFQTFTAVDCAGPGCYAFTIEDTFGDGICCGYGSGGYSIAADDVVLATGGSFGYQATESFCLEFLCTDEAACNYDPTAEVVDPSEENCQYPEDLFGPGYDCEGQCINDEDGDDVCDEVDPCIGEFDACGVCNGPGEIYECGCFDQPEEDCDCNGNQLDALGECGGNCAVDADADGICDECIPPPGFSIDIDEVMVHTEGALEGMVTYQVSLICENEADFLEAISGGGTGVLEIASTTGTWYNHPANPSWNPSGLVGDSIALYPDLAYDSFLTIGADDADAGPFPTVVGWVAESPLAEFEPDGGNNLVIDAGTGSCYFLYPGPSEVGNHPGFAGDDLRVLLMQITTAGEISGQIPLRIRPEGQNPYTEILPFDSEDYCFNLDDCILDVCGVCNGPGDIYECGCFGVPEGDCDCDGNQLDAIDVCGGACPSDNNENGICDTEEFGCNNPEACNFISADLIDDGSCFFAEQYYDCDGECINDDNDNDVCDELDLEGCMQDFSCNFNPAATIPDTSCIYPGDDCDDNDPETVNDQVTEACGCEGEIPGADGIDALAQWGIEMYPSPVQDVLRIQFRGDAHGATIFTMTSMSGQTVRSRTLQSDATVDVSDLASGVYFATFEGTWGKATRRVMVTSGR